MSIMVMVLLYNYVCVAFSSLMSSCFVALNTSLSHGLFCRKKRSRSFHDLTTKSTILELVNFQV